MKRQTAGGGGRDPSVGSQETAFSTASQQIAADGTIRPTTDKYELGEATVTCGLYAPLLARAYISRWLDGRADAELRADACLLVSEVVTNSILHADQPADAQLRITAAALDTLVRVEVQDHGHDPVRQRAPDPPDRTLGLDLVELIAAHWGIDHEQGTRVWFELATFGRPV